MLCFGVCLWSIPLSHDHLETETGLIHPLYALGAIPSFVNWNKSFFMKTSYKGKRSHAWNTKIIFKDSWMVLLCGLSDGSDGVRFHDLGKKITAAYYLGLLQPWDLVLEGFLMDHKQVDGLLATMLRSHFLGYLHWHEFYSLNRFSQ